MSNWTHIRGVICVDVDGETEEQCDFILKSALKFLPKVKGSERDMEYHIAKKRWE